MSDPMVLAYEERGSGPAMIFVHGFPFDRTMWIPQLAGLAKHRTCIAIDLRGHGLSEVASTSTFSMDLFADDIVATMDDLKLDQADLCGLSMGGYVLFAMWRRAPERIRSLTFIDTKAEVDSDEAKAGREKAAEAIAADGMEAFHDVLGPKLVGENPSADVIEHMKRMFLSCPPEVAAADSLAMRDRDDSTATLATISVPSAWLHGEQDKVMPIDAARATAEKIPGCSFSAIPDAGHVSNLENPDAVNAALTAFLKG